jgi:hypothetical protein
MSTATDEDAPATRRWTLWVVLWVEGLLLVAGGLGMLVYGMTSVGLHGYLPSVHVYDLKVWQPSQRDDEWIKWLAIGAVTMIVLTGRAKLAEGRSFWSARGSVGGACTQVIGGLVGAFVTLFWAALGNSGPMVRPVPDCVYDGCWPRQAELLADLTPGVLGGLALVVMGCLVTKVPWWIRATTPALVWLGAFGVQYLIWDSYYMPLFQGPPW